MKWISIEDRLPTTDDEFLVSIDGDVSTCNFNPWPSEPSQNLEYSYEWFYDRDVQNWGSERCEVMGVTHWMPLPGPPQQ